MGPRVCSKQGLRLARVPALALLLLAPAAGYAASPNESAPPDPGATSAPASRDPLLDAEPQRRMSLPEARAYARVHQPSLQSALARLAAARAGTAISRAAWLPNLGVTAQGLVGTTNNTTASYLGSPDVDLPRIGGTRVESTGSWSPHVSTLVAGGLRQELLDFGRIAAETAVADARAVEESFRTEEERLRVDFLVQEAFYAVEGARAIREAARGALARSSIHRDLARASVKSGLHAPIELTRAEADYARFQVGWLRATGSLRAAQAALAAAIGAPEPLVDTVGGSASLAPPPELAEAERQAAAHDPTLQVAQQRIVAADRMALALGAQSRPDLYASATLSARDGNAPPSSGSVSGYAPLPLVANWDVGLALTWPVFDGVLQARRKVADDQVTVARADAEAIRQQRNAALREAFLAYRMNVASLESLREAVRAAQANDAQADARFRSGLGTSVELADAEALRADAEIQLAIGQFETGRARARISQLIAEAP